MIAGDLFFVVVVETILISNIIVGEMRIASPRQPKRLDDMNVGITWLFQSCESFV